MTLRFTSAAHNELRQACLYYEAQQHGLGSGLIAEVELALERIRSNPEAWRRMSKRTRRCLVHRFPYGLLYQTRRDEILILSVMDLRRDPESWRKHL